VQQQPFVCHRVHKKDFPKTNGNLVDDVDSRDLEIARFGYFSGIADFLFPPLVAVSFQKQHQNSPL
jgi:hypothetical protein